MEKNSSDKNPIDDFKLWALKLGCPVNALPSDAALNRFIKSNHANVHKLRDQIRPKSEVKLIKDNLLFNSLTKSNFLSERHQSDLPNSLKSIKKVEKLTHQISQLKPRVEQLKAEVKDKKTSLSKKADELTEVRKNHHNNRTKCIQLEQKHAQLSEKIGEEKKFEAMLKDSMPVQISASNNQKSEADKVIKKLIQLLKNVYDEAGDCAFTKTEREKVERDIQKIMSGIPVVTLFEAIKFYSDNEMKAVDNKFTSIDIHPLNDGTFSAFDVAITKSRMKIYVDYLKTKKMKEEHEVGVEQYVDRYDEYLARIIDEMKLFNEHDVELFGESICGDYLKHYGTWTCNQIMLEFLQQKLTDLQRLASERDALLKGSELVTSELSALYALIEKTYNSTLDDIVSLGEVNRSMKQLQALSKYTINSFGNKSIWNTSTSMLNCTLGSVGPSITINLAPAEYLHELSMLVDVANEKWNKLPSQISMDIESHHSKEMILPFYSLLTPNTALKEFTLKWAWHKVIDVLSQPLDVYKPVPQFTDAELVSSKLTTECTKMSKLIEDIKFMYQTGSKTALEIQKYLAFLLDTSLGSFIPGKMVINRRNFQDYEAEFLCACSLISNSKK